MNAQGRPRSMRLEWWVEHLLRLRLLIALAVAFGLAAPALIIAQREGANVRQETFSQLGEDLTQLTEVSAESLRDSLWQLTPELGNTIALAVFRDPRIRMLRVRASEARLDKTFPRLPASARIRRRGYFTTARSVLSGPPCWLCRTVFVYRTG